MSVILSPYPKTVFLSLTERNQVDNFDPVNTAIISSIFSPHNEIMADTPIRFGIIGCAEIARKVSRAIQLAPNASLSAVASRSIAKAANFAKANGFPPEAKIYGSYESLLDDPDIDAVYLPLPTSLHLKWAVLTVQKKKHLLTEKPVALNVDEFDEILKACEENGVQIMDGTMWVHHPRTQKMKEFLNDKERFGLLKTEINGKSNCWNRTGDQLTD